MSFLKRTSAGQYEQKGHRPIVKGLGSYERTHDSLYKTQEFRVSLVMEEDLWKIRSMVSHYPD